eukprot:scaffold9965_cov64-Phaeocystis_antarctica.AAC.7
MQPNEGARARRSGSRSRRSPRKPCRSTTDTGRSTATRLVVRSTRVTPGASCWQRCLATEFDFSPCPSFWANGSVAPLTAGTETNGSSVQLVRDM